MRLTSFTRTVMATVLAVAAAMAGIVVQAQAFTFTDGDLVLAIYGNNTEALYNLGNASAILSGPGIVNQDVSAGLTAASVGTLANVRYTLFGFNLTANSVYAGTAFAPAAITGAFDMQSQFNATINMTTSPFSGNTIGKSTLGSFSSYLNTAGAAKFEGAWPVAMQGSLDQVINIMNASVDSNAFSQVGRALLTANGLFSVGNPGPAPAAVPLPAGVVLFGTGLIGLVGIARRSFNRMTS